MSNPVRDRLLAARGRRYMVEAVTMPDGDVVEFRIQSLTNSEHARWHESRFDRKTGKPRKLEDIRASLVQLTLVDDDGQLALSLTDKEALGGLDGSVVNQLYEAAFEHCRLGGRYVDDAGKNSSGTDDDADKSA